VATRSISPLIRQEVVNFPAAMQECPSDCRKMLPPVVNFLILPAWITQQDYW
jgi:hypothetical protein